MAQKQCDTIGHTYANAVERTCSYCGDVREAPEIVTVTFAIPRSLTAVVANELATLARAVKIGNGNRSTFPDEDAGRAISVIAIAVGMQVP